MILYFLRHGESKSNKKNIFAAKKINPPLTILGKQQADVQAKRLKNVGFEGIFTSPLLRAKQTAEIVGKYCDQKPITSDYLYEINIGILDGKSMAEQHYWGIWENVLRIWQKGDKHTAFPDGENLYNVGERFKRFMGEIKDTNKPILVVSHCGFFMAILWLFCNNHGPAIEDVHMGRGCLTIVKKSNDNYYIEKFNIEPNTICD